MKNFKGFAMGLVVGLALAVSGIGFAQEASKDSTKDKAACCATASCCGDSCSMKHAAGHDSKSHSAKDGCCCCSGDSCDMKMKEHKENKENKEKQG